ncbi:hypothetical protein BCR35DRAFT_306163 [Leucosporidium creatinivorum]|uniref:Large ribosomal subunit protein uL23m n=1 Tax=Leucosporidium creatinivorum TaxID=106004 RepID=A0A1Y2EWZ8_9BASI|nr:hypothetical protein BCR35DRAFT_306163 [Leucosporidium creatinivorum]
MQALRKTAQALSLLRSAASPIPSTSRALATVVDSSYTAPSVSSRRASSPSTSSKKQPKNPYIVAAPVEQPKAARFSKNSSRIKGRTPNRPRKALNLTELKEGAQVGTFEQATGGEVKIFLPSVFMRLVRNTGVHADDPYTATFRTDLRLTKPDISNYLKNIYGLGITSLRTINYQSAMKRNPIGGGYSRSGGVKNYKKVLVGLTQPFWYPEERGREWCNEHFMRDTMEEARDRKMLKIGDGQKYGVQSTRYRGARKSRAEIERLEAIVKNGGPGEGSEKSDGKSGMRLPMGLKKRKNVVRSRAEKITEGETKVEAEMRRLQEAGW